MLRTLKAISKHACSSLAPIHNPFGDGLEDSMGN
jgi:hypothetical protein